MSQIAAVFKPDHKAFIAYLTVGYPDLDATRKAAVTLASDGADIIELGIPFSDPLADGTTIQRASHQARQNGVTLPACFETARQIRREIAVPLVFMTYYNPVYNLGLDAFCRRCVEAGVNGLIVPDLPPEEGQELEGVTQEHGLDLIYLLAPTSSEERIRLVAEHSQGFIYLVSVTGVTGARDKLPDNLNAFITQVRKVTKKPLCVGFGISNAEQAQQLAGIADGVIIGSRIIQLMEADGSLAELTDFTSQVRHALNQTI
ncbi:MAG TPA: tryptophan synthase subunit alpha [Dehalococcoidia bacterium]|nr:tryptophan synthase subunit alpha [Dehalococcoidia bacterium]